MADFRFNFEETDETSKFDSAFEQGKEAIVVLIDCGEAMFKRVEGGNPTTPFVLALRVAKNLMRRKIFTSKRDMIGIAFFGSREKKSRHAFDHIYELQTLDVPTVERITQIESLTQAAEGDPTSVDSQIGTDPPDSRTFHSRLERALWYAVLQFGELGKWKAADWKRVIVLTNDADPTGADVGTNQRTRRHAVDLARDDTDVELWPVGRTREGFDLSSFWSPLLEDHLKSSPSEGKPNPSEEEILNHVRSKVRFVEGDDPTNVEELIQIVRKQESAKRKMASLTLNLGFGMDIGVALYLKCSPAKIPTPVQLEAETARPLKIETRFLDKETMTDVLKHEIGTFAQYGNQGLVPVSQADMEAVKRFPTSFTLGEGGDGVVVPVDRTYGASSSSSSSTSTAPPETARLVDESGITLLGFKPQSEIPLWMTTRAAYFLRPDEALVTGSTKAFLGLLGSMSKKRLTAMVQFVPRRNSAPILAALFPQLEEISEEGGEVSSPAGLLLVPLPFADDIRKIKFPAPFARAEESQVSKAKALIELLPLANEENPFDPADYENPEIQKHFIELEALALNRPPDEFVDLLMPDNERFVFDERYRDPAMAFAASFGGAGDIRDPKKEEKEARAAAAAEKRRRRAEETAKKKQSAKKGGATGSKKRKRPGSDDDDDDDDDEAVMEVEEDDDEPGVPKTDQDWERLAKERLLQQCTVPLLKDFCRAKKLPLSGTKDVLVGRIESFFNSKR